MNEIYTVAKRGQRNWQIVTQYAVIRNSVSEFLYKCLGYAKQSKLNRGVMQCHCITGVYSGTCL